MELKEGLKQASKKEREERESGWRDRYVSKGLMWRWGSREVGS